MFHPVRNLVKISLFNNCVTNDNELNIRSDSSPVRSSILPDNSSVQRFQLPVTHPLPAPRQDHCCRCAQVSQTTAQSH